jgi:secreted trypsin-like serine protease
MSGRAAIVAPAALLLAVACNPVDQAARSNDELIGGTRPDAGAFAATVYLEDGCTGAHVAPRRILTAAHCVVDPATVTVRYAAGTTVALGPAPGALSRITVVAVHVHPAWIEACARSFCATSAITARLDAPDVAVIELSADLADVAIAPVSGAALVPGARVTAVGFGCTSGVFDHDPRAGASPLAHGETEVVAPDAAAHDGSPIAPADIERVGGIYAMTRGPAGGGAPGLCPGDSGGPLYVERAGGPPVVVGVNANYTFAPAERDRTGIPVTNWHTRVDESSRHAVAAWLRSVGVAVT